MLFKRRSKKKDFDVRESILVDIVTKRFDELNEKLDKILFLSDVHTDININTYQEHDNNIRVVDMR